MADTKNDASFPLPGTLYRPSIHFTPSTGFMNDPNGLLFDGAVYHLYYQYNPQAAYSADICWGHAISTDLLSWQDQPVALPNTAEGQAFSGCAVLDRDNHSGLFAAQGGTNIVALYTRSLPTRQSQYLAISTDKGQSFKEYAANPVLDIGSPDFRDPQVLYHEPTQKWVMVIAEVERHRIGFYTSSDLIHWARVSQFGPAGLPGVNYECPNLIQVKDETGTRRWVLFISINPGSPMGGSATQYFIGDFDGTTFTPCDAIFRLTDFAKDAYALQVWSNMPHDEAVNIAWMGNWQYCQEVPSQPWRGVMSLPRSMSIRQDPNGYPRLVQTPRGVEKLRQPLLSEASTYLPQATGRDIPLPVGKPVEIVIRLTVDEPHADNGPANAPIQHELPHDISAQQTSRQDGPIIQRFVLAFINGAGEALSIGYDVPSTQIWLDRSKLRGFDHPFFTGRFAAPINTAITSNRRSFDLRLFLDGCAFELYANEHFETASALVYPENPLDRLRLTAEGIGLTIDQLDIYTLDRTMRRETL